MGFGQWICWCDFVKERLTGTLCGRVGVSGLHFQEGTLIKSKVPGTPYMSLKSWTKAERHITS